MIATIEQEIITKLRGLNIFASIDSGVRGENKLLQVRGALPSAVLSLLENRQISQRPQCIRELRWELSLCFSCLSFEQAKRESGQKLDLLRTVFEGWRTGVAGFEPVQVSMIQCQGVNLQRLIWLMELTCLYYPQNEHDIY